jgi:sugar/nucleoside kinase (ribokinase family)
MHALRIDSRSPFRQLIGIGGVGTGVFFKLAGDHTLGRNESRSGELLDVRDYCKLHIVIHYVAKLLGAAVQGSRFEVVPLAKIGDDAAGRSVLREMQDAGITTRFIETLRGKPTLFSVCFQYPDGAGGNITTSNSAAAELCNADVGRLREQFTRDPKRTVALSVPEVPLSVRFHFLEAATAAGSFRAASFVAGEIADAKQMRMFQLLDLLALNESEAAELLGSKYSDDAQSFVDKCVSFVNDCCPGMRLIVSLGARGVLGFAGEWWKHYPAPRVPVSSTAGAGDALFGGVIAGLAAGIPFLSPGPSGKSAQDEPLQSALQLGVMLGTYSITSPHTIHPSACLDTLLSFLESLQIPVGQNVADLFVDCSN